MPHVKIDNHIPIPVSVVPSDASVQSVKNAAVNYTKTHGIKFTVHKTQDGYRVWRIK